MSSNEILFNSEGIIEIIDDPLLIENYKVCYKLPDDRLSVENALIINFSKKYPLCIDPQNQANIFIRKMCSEVKKELFKVIKPTDQKILNELEFSIKMGKWVLVEKMGETIHPDLEPIINPILKIKGKSKMIKIGDKEIEFNEDFKVFLTTTLPNPM